MPDETPIAQQRTTQGDWRPIPDPTVLTTEAQVRGLQAERDYVNGQVAILTQRIEGIDKATELLNQTVNRTPTQIQTEVSHVRELINERFDSIATQFNERDTRQERESRDNKVAVDAAFAAADKAAAKSEDVFQASITKSENATAETISKLQDLTATQAKGLTDKIDDLREAWVDKLDDLKARTAAIESRVIAIEARVAGSRESVSDHQAIGTSNYQWISVLIGALIIAVALYAALHK